MAGVVKYRDFAVRGVVYPDVRTAAVALGLTEKRVREAVRSDRLAYLGLGQGRRARMQVALGGQIFDGIAAAARFAGCTESAVMAAISDGDPDRVLRPAPGSLGRPVSLCGRCFASQAALAAWAGVSNTTVSMVLRGKVSARRRDAFLGRVMRKIAQEDQVAVRDRMRRRAAGGVAA